MKFSISAVFLTLAGAVAAQNNALVGYGAGTTGGGSAARQAVTSCSALATAAGSSSAAVITISGTLSGCGQVDVKSNKSILGVGSNAGLVGGGLRIRRSSNVIIRNLNFGIPHSKGDALALDEATKVWIDHNTFKTAGLTGDKDAYDGQLDATHASDFVTISWNKFSDHWKGSLVGHSDSNSGEDTGKLRITYHHNSFTNVNSRTPSVRFGTAHIYNNVYNNVPTSGINSRMGAKVLVQNSVFNNVKLAIVTDLDSDTDGYVQQSGNVLNNSTTRITQTTTVNPGYSYTLDSTSGLESLVSNNAGAGKISV